MAEAVIAYASRTGTRKNLAELRRHGWRLLVSARGVLRCEGFPYALDNGAWTSFQNGEPFDVKAFERAVSLMGDAADWIVAPDIVCGGLESLRFSLDWLPRIPGRVLLAVQDGIEPEDVEPYLSERVGIAIGGSTAWKEKQLAERRWRASWLHVLRVNTARRIRLCHWAGATSFDGSGASRFACSVRMLDRERKAPTLPLETP